MAKVFIDTSAHSTNPPRTPDFATRWYTTSHSEPAGGGTNLAIASVHALATATLDSLLDAIIANCAPRDDIIVVGHGRDTGLSLRLFPRSESRAQYQIINSLGTMTVTRSEFGDLPAITDDAAAVTCQITVAQVASLRSKIRQVRALRLNHVALRGCKIGAWPSVLAYYKPFFGCSVISGPQYRDTYGLMPCNVVSSLATWTNDWARNHRVNSHTMQYTAEQMVVGTSGGSTDEHRYSVEAVGTSQSIISAWQSTYIGFTSTGSTPFHGQFLVACLTGQPRILFTGDPHYATNIVVQ